MKRTAGVRNIYSREPPFSNNVTRTLGFAQTHNVRGRYFYFGATYSF